MTDDIRMKYDAMCYAIMANVLHLSKGAKKISFEGFDAENKEHLCVLSVTVACIGLLGDRTITIDCDKSARTELARKYKEVCKITNPSKKDTQTINICDMIEFMHPACEDFTFADIYNEYYEGDK